MYLSSFLLAAVAAIASVQATPLVDLVGGTLNTLKTRDLSGSQCVSFLAGNDNQNFGQVCVTISAGTVTITYPTLTGGKVYTDLHAIISTSAITEANQGKWPYTLGNGKCSILNGGTDATCGIPVDAAWRVCNKDLYIGVHASFGVPGTGGQTGWGAGTCITTRPNCPRYFIFTTKCECSVVTTYDPFTTSLVYTVTKTIYETSTTSCSMTKAPATATATCTNPNSAAVETVSGGPASTPGFACTTPAQVP